MPFIQRSRYAGFNMVKMRSRGGMPVAFADFEVTNLVLAVQGSIGNVDLVGWLL